MIVWGICFVVILVSRMLYQHFFVRDIYDINDFIVEFIPSLLLGVFYGGVAAAIIGLSVAFFAPSHEETETIYIEAHDDETSMSDGYCVTNSNNVYIKFDDEARIVVSYRVVNDVWNKLCIFGMEKSVKETNIFMPEGSVVDDYKIDLQ